MTEKHTPGPWFWQTSCSYRRLGSSGFDGNVLYPTKQSDGHPDISFPNGGFQGPDAQLIASAPELLDALIGLEDAYCRAGSPLTRKERHEDRMRLMAARAAIAIATSVGTKETP